MTDKKQEQLTEQELDKVTGGGIFDILPPIRHRPPKSKGYRKGSHMYATEQEPEDNK